MRLDLLNKRKNKPTKSAAPTTPPTIAPLFVELGAALLFTGSSVDEEDAWATLVGDMDWELEGSIEVKLGIKDVAGGIEELLITEEGSIELLKTDDGRAELLTMDDGTTELDIIEVGADELTIALLEGIALLVVVVVDGIKLEVVVVLDSTTELEVVVGTTEEDSTVVVVVGTSDEEVVIGATVVLDVVGSGELVVGSIELLVGSIELVVGSIELIVGSIEREGLAELVVGSTVVVGFAAVVVVVLSAEVILTTGSAEVAVGFSVAAVVVILSEVEATDSSVLEIFFSSEDVVTGSSVEVTSLLVLLVTFSVLESANVDAAWLSVASAALDVASLLFVLLSAVDVISFPWAVVDSAISWAEVAAALTVKLSEP